MIIQVRRGTTEEAAAHVGMEGSFFIDLVLKNLYIHDGTTAGGSMVGGLNEAGVQTLIDASLVSHEVEIAKVTGLTEALEAVVKTDAVGVTVASLVDGKVPVAQLPEQTFGETQFLAIATEFGFTKGEDGKWILDQNTGA